MRCRCWPCRSGFQTDESIDDKSVCLEGRIAASQKRAWFPVAYLGALQIRTSMQMNARIGCKVLKNCFAVEWTCSQMRLVTKNVDGTSRKTCCKCLIAYGSFVVLLVWFNKKTCLEVMWESYWEIEKRQQRMSSRNWHVNATTIASGYKNLKRLSCRLFCASSASLFLCSQIQRRDNANENVPKSSNHKTKSRAFIAALQSAEKQLNDTLTDIHNRSA